MSRLLPGDDEVINPVVQPGKLNDSEREVINNHIVATKKILESLALPKNLQNVPLYAGGLHEIMNGTGYPRRLKREEMSMQARIMVITGTFEALTANDGPCKRRKNYPAVRRLQV